MIPNRATVIQSICLLLVFKNAVLSFMPQLNLITSSSSFVETNKKHQQKKLFVATTPNTNHNDELQGTSLIEDTLQGMKEDEEFIEIQNKMSTIGLKGMAKEERLKRNKALHNLGLPSFSYYIKKDHDIQETLKKKECKILQINIGLFCNQACSHCHVESSPLRKEENMSDDTIIQCIKLLKATPSITTVDITGGAPELNKHFRLLVSMIRDIRPDIEIIDRSNLTVVLEPGMGYELIEFLKEHNVRIIASLPCYSKDNVDKQRGRGVFDRSIVALQMFNEKGYGISSSSHKLDLVYNPNGAFLPPSQEKLEIDYKKQLMDNFGIQFSGLFTITNMPIKRFVDYLYKNDELEDYMNLLVQNFNVHTLDNIMCLDLVSVGFDGKIYDCDFNQQLGMQISSSALKTKQTSIFDLESFNDLLNNKIKTDSHCFGCTAGAGSS